MNSPHELWAALHPLSWLGAKHAVCIELQLHANMRWAAKSTLACHTFARDSQQSVYILSVSIASENNLGETVHSQVIARVGTFLVSSCNAILEALDAEPPNCHHRLINHANEPGRCFAAFHVPPCAQPSKSYRFGIFARRCGCEAGFVVAMWVSQLLHRSNLRNTFLAQASRWYKLVLVSQDERRT